MDKQNICSIIRYKCLLKGVLTVNNNIKKIYNDWDSFAKSKQTEKLVNLYDENAIFESPLVPAILDNKKTGILNGKEEIRFFLEEGAKRRPNELVKWYRTGEYLFNKNTLVWEYPRQMEDGEQLDILELMKIEDGLIIEHRIYWGWKGCMQISKSLAERF